MEGGGYKDLTLLSKATPSGDSGDVSKPSELVDRYSTLPPEVRLLIVEELLVASEPIVFVLDRIKWTTCSMELRGLHPAILRVSHLVGSEGAKILYSKNVFALREHGGDVSLYRQAGHMRLFLEHIGKNTKLIRHIEIPFPAFYYDNDLGTGSNTYLGGAGMSTLQNFWHCCTGLRTLTLVLSGRKVQSVSREKSKIFKKAVDVLSHFIQSSSSKPPQVIVKIDAVAIRADLQEKMIERKWLVVMDSLL